MTQAEITYRLSTLNQLYDSAERSNDNDLKDAIKKAILELLKY